MRCLPVIMACCLLATASARAQGLPGEIVPAGETVATTTDANSGRINMGAVPLASAMSLRLTGVGEFQRSDTAMDALALTATVPLYFEFAAAVGLTWRHVLVPSRMTGGVPSRGDIVTGEVGLGYALLRNLGIGTRVRVSGAGGESGLQSQNGAVNLDVGIAWRPVPALSFGITGTNLLGPQFHALGIDRAVVVGVGLRPTGTDTFTLGIDGSFAEAGTGWIRAGVRVRLPGIGFARAEGIGEYPSGNVRGSVGLELGWGGVAAGGGVMYGANVSGANGPAQLGGYASVRFEPVRDRGLPEPGVLVAVPLAGDPTPRTLAHLILRLERLRHDPAVRGVIFEPRDDAGGLANAEDLRDEFARWHASGRYVACHLTEPVGSAYGACAAADTIAMDPAGSLRTAGIRTAYFFLGDALHDLGVRTEFVRIGAWKSAPEQFTQRGSSPEARAQEEQLLDDFYANFIDSLAAARSAVHTRNTGLAAIEPARMRALIEAGPYTARGAMRAGLIDVLASRDAAERQCSREAHASAVVRLDDYAPFRPRQWTPGRGIAVVYIDGDMVDGESSDIPLVGLHFVGERTITPVLDALAGNPSIGAIVLRVDSGGGSALAGELMWRAVQRAARRKPVIVSMARVAASAAYYISAPAAEIVADPSAITGSIGIFFGRADIAPLLTRLDVGVELLRRGPRADMDSMFRAWTADERDVIARLIGEFYDQFLQRVASGRHMSVTAVNDIGEGRVFSATRARTLGLVDRIGGLATALERARHAAGLDDSSPVTELPAEPGGLLATLASLLARDSGSVPDAATQIMAQSSAREALAWLFAVSRLGAGDRPLAMLEWPMLAP